MEVQYNVYDGVIVLQVAGEIDGSSAPVLQEQVLSVAEPGCRMLLDVSLVEFMSSAGLRVMLLLHRQITGGGGQIVLSGLSDSLRDTMDATGFLKHFMTTQDMDSGMEVLRQ